jgi:hypothetical protein
MNVQAIFGVSALLSLISSCVLAYLYLWPRLRRVNREDALAVLAAPHMFLRFIGLSFLVPGVVSPTLPGNFAVPAAYGDLVAGVLAIVATIALFKRAAWAIAAAWIFNLWGAADLIFAGVQGALSKMDAGALGAAFYIPTAIVPPLLVTHALGFLLLIQPVAADSRRA